jgi:hypothetical protein
VLASCLGRVVQQVASAVSEVSCAGVWVMSVGGPLDPMGEERSWGPVGLTGDGENCETWPSLDSIGVGTSCCQAVVESG